MSDSLRYKIVLWMVWVQITLLPVIILMITVTESGVMWRWNLINNLLVVDYILGLLALPVSRELEKPRLLKWWLRIDFWLSLIPAILVLPLLFYCGRHYIDAEDEEYMLYHITGLMAAAPHYSLGKKEDLFIRDMSESVRINDYDNRKVDCFKVDTLKGCFYGINRGSAMTSWVLPLDSAKYHQFSAEIVALIDSVYQSQPLFSSYHHGRFVFPDNFAEIGYEGERIYYTDSISYDINLAESDSLKVTILKDKFPHLSIPKNAIGNFSPQEVRTFIEKLKGGMVKNESNW